MGFFTAFAGLRVSYLHSSIFLAPKCHCDSVKYFFDDDLANKTVAAHKWINGNEPDVGCMGENAGRYEKGIRYFNLSVLCGFTNNGFSYILFHLAVKLKG